MRREKDILPNFENPKLVYKILFYLKSEEGK